MLLIDNEKKSLQPHRFGKPERKGENATPSLHEKRGGRKGLRNTHSQKRRSQTFGKNFQKKEDSAIFAPDSEGKGGKRPAMSHTPHPVAIEAGEKHESYYLK